MLICNINMAPTGFGPATPGLKVQCSDQTELRSHTWQNSEGWSVRGFS